MLSKLIKHEFRATSRIMWPVFLGMLILSTLMRVALPLTGSDSWTAQLIAILLVMGYGFSLFALVFAPLVLSACRWRDHVLKDEGYLTLTLPVSMHELLASKLIVFAVWYAAAFLVGCLSLLIGIAGWSDMRYVPTALGELFTSFFQMEAVLRGHALLGLLELLGNFVFLVSAASLMVYAAYSIGYSFNKHKALWTTILVIVFYQAAQFVAILMLTSFTTNIPNTFDGANTALRTAQVGELLLLWGMLGELLFCAIGYAVTWYFTTKKLNLE